MRPQAITVSAVMLASVAMCRIEKSRKVPWDKSNVPIDDGYLTICETPFVIQIERMQVTAKRDMLDQQNCDNVVRTAGDED